MDVVLVRTRGVWGSSFTYVRTGHTPRLGRCFRNGLLWLAANLLFFMPARASLISRSSPWNATSCRSWSRDPVNRWFEAWYNADGPERPTYVPYHFLFGPRSYEFLPVSGPLKARSSRIRFARRRARPLPKYSPTNWADR